MQEIFDRIQNRCIELNSTFLRIENKKGDIINECKGECYIITKCNICGNIVRKRRDHFFNSYGCKTCSNTKQKISLETALDIIDKKCKRRNYIFLNFCDSNENISKWNGANTYLLLKCLNCGHIWKVSYNNFKSKHDYGCPKCANNIRLLETDVINTIKKRCEEINDTFISFYDSNNYVNNSTLILIKCGKCGKIYKIRYKNFVHLKQSCPSCQKSYGERDIEEVLSNAKINFNYRDKTILKNKLEIDFYIPSLKLGIEVQGGQHFYEVKHWGGENVFKKQLERDKMKQALCEENGIHLIYYSQLNISFPYKVFNDKNEILKEIEEYARNIS